MAADMRSHPTSPRATPIGRGGEDLPERATVERVIGQLVPAGAVLPRTRTFGPVGYPVVAFDHRAMASRRASEAGPVLRLQDVARLMSQPSGDQVPSALRLLAFIGVSRPSQAPRALSGIRALCRVVLVVPTADSIGEPLLSEFDLMGVTVATVEDPGEVRVLVAGDPGRRPGSDLHPAWVRLREEQMFALALGDSERGADLAYMGG
jgi:hypothetical protein